MALLAVVWLVAVPLALRLGPEPSLSFNDGVSPGAGHALLMGRGGFNARAAWLVDFDADTRRFLGPSCQLWRWSSDGSTLAYLSEAGPFGTLGETRVEFVDTKSGRSFTTRAAPAPGALLYDLRWIGDEFFMAWYVGDGLFLIRSVDARGEQTRPQWRVEGQLIRIAGSNGRELIVHVQDDDRVALLALALDTHAAPRVLLEEPAPLIDGRRRLSPSGRIWMRTKTTTSPRRLVDLADPTSPVTLELPALGREKNAPRWLAGDRLAWLENDEEDRYTLYTARPGSEARAVKTWRGLEHLSLLAEPDGTRVLVSAFTPGATDDEHKVHTELYDPASESWRDLGELGSAWLYWAGPGAIGMEADGRKLLWRIDLDEEPREL